MKDVTSILSSAQAGDLQAAEKLLPLVYDELRKLAAVRLAREKPGQTLQATALVHEAYLRLVRNPGPAEAGSRAFSNRAHFFAAAAEAMRRILVERARHKHSEKRGGDRERADQELDAIAAPARSAELIAVDDAIDGLTAVNPMAASVVKLRYFVGLSMADVADILDVSPRSADRAWAYARAWLHDALREEAS